VQPSTRELSPTEMPLPFASACTFLTMPNFPTLMPVANPVIVPFSTVTSPTAALTTTLPFPVIETKEDWKTRLKLGGGNRRDRDRYRLPYSIPLGEDTYEALVYGDVAVHMLQLKASPDYSAVSEETYVLLAEYDRFDHFGRRVVHQQRFCDGLVQGSQTGEVIREDVSQRRAVALPVRFIPLAI
jgi:hypothetical protein